MNKSFKTAALLVAAISVVPVTAVDYGDVKPGDVIGTIGGEITQVNEGDVVGTIGGPITQVTSETTEKSEGSSIGTFLSKHRDGILGFLIGIAAYRLCSGIATALTLKRTIL